jgi:acetoin utilization deacetylase AcuC-like enzyme
MAVLFATSPRYLDHLAGIGHPERPQRLEAVLAGARRAGIADALVPLEPRAATLEELTLVHPADYVAGIERVCRTGGGKLDPDTSVVPASWDAAVLAAGAGLAAVDALRRGEGDAAFCAVRPPGHHATVQDAMGFCLFNNVAVVAASLVERGERVAIVDYDAHHGNGTQDIFYADPRVFYVSMHQFPLYPGSGRLFERGSGLAEGTTMNLPFPPETTGDVYLAALDRVVLPTLEMFAPTWLIVSAGFDAHRRDPLTDLALTSGDFARLTKRLCSLVPKGRRIAVLEGGYDLQALESSSAAALAVLAGVDVEPDEPATSGGPGMRIVDASIESWLGY